MATMYRPLLFRPIFIHFLA